MSTHPLNPPQPPRISPLPGAKEPQHPNFQDVINVAATHIAPQSPAPTKDAEREATEPSGEQDHGGVVARRAGEGDLLRDDVEVGVVEGVKATRPGLGAGRIGSARGGSQTLFGLLSSIPTSQQPNPESSPSDTSDGESDFSTSDDEAEPGSKSLSYASPSQPRRGMPQRMHSSLDTITTAMPPSTQPTLLAPILEPVLPSRAPSNPASDLPTPDQPFATQEEPTLTSQISPSPLTTEPTSFQHHRADSDAHAMTALRGGSPSASLLPENPVEAVDGGEVGAGRGERRESKAERGERLAGKLKEVFGLPGGEEMLVEMPCWSLRELLLQGYLYLTSSHICFFAHMPKTDNVIVKTGPLSRRSARTKLSTKFWFVLKNDVLSWHESSTDPYFPKGNVPLQYCLTCEPKYEKEIKLRTSEKTYTFLAETKASRDDWVKAVNKVIFKTRNEGDHVKIAIPLEAIDSVEKSPTLEFAETIEINVIDPDDSMSIDSYFFAYFRDTDKALKDIQDLLLRFKQTERAGLEGIRPIVDTMQEDKANDLTAGELERVRSMGSTKSVPLLEEKEPVQGLMKSSTSPPESGSGSSLARLTSKLNPFGSSSSKDDLTRTSSRQSDAGSVSSRAIMPPIMESRGMSDSQDTMRPMIVRQDSLTYPPAPTEGVAPPGMEDDANASWAQKLLRSPTNALSKQTSNSSGLSRPVSRVTEVFGSLLPGKSKEKPEEDDEYERMEKSEEGERIGGEVEEKFRKVFALGEDEELLEHFPGFLYRVLPVSGRFFISTRYFCFRSTQLLQKTQMMIPIKDITSTKVHRAYRIGHAGLLLILKGYEELFLEFSSKDRRQQVMNALEVRIEELRFAQETEDAHAAATKEGKLLEELDTTAGLDGQPHPDRASLPNRVTPASDLFDSTTSALLEFKPDKRLNITLLTIGSRGDVQPYIALAKGLQAENHIPTIASHAEYREWVEGHGILFRDVGGDPAELLSLCVDKGMFTFGFLKEGVTKFRTWLSDLLMTSWEASQGADLLIESPSAMGGIHVAEGLGIPYYRAFTMPWTRTRSYPHAFAVPSSKRGGGYNWMTYTAFDQVFWQATSPQINKFRRQIGLENTDFNTLAQHLVPFVYNFSAQVLPPPLDWNEHIKVTGYWTLEGSEDSHKKKFEPPKDLVEWMKAAREATKKIVYIGFGSIVVSDPQEMTRVVVDAVVESDVWCILCKGWSERGKKKESAGDEADGIKLPDQIYSIDSIDHGWLFPHIDAAVHHGGAGTTGASLRAGLPTIIHPFFGDQFLWANRVDDLNVGTGVRKLTKSNLSEALKKATTDEKQIEKARILGKAIRAEHGVARAIEFVYRELDYAKSLIKPLPSPERRAELRGLSLETTQSMDQGLEPDNATVDGKRLSSSDFGVASGSTGTANGSNERSDWSMVSGPAGASQSELGGSEADGDVFEGAGHDDEGEHNEKKKSGVMGVLGKVKLPKFGIS